MQKQKLVLILPGLLGFVILGIAAWFLARNLPAQSIQPSTAAATSTYANRPTQPPTVPGGLAYGTHPEVRRVTLEQAKSAFDARSAIFVDVRSPSFYAYSHIPGAVNIPLADLAARVNELDPEQWIITYCT